MIPLSIEGHVHYLINVSPCISFCDGLCSLVFLWLLLRESSHHVKEYVRVSVSNPNLRIVFGIRTWQYFRGNRQHFYCHGEFVDASLHVPCDSNFLIQILIHNDPHILHRSLEV